MFLELLLCPRLCGWDVSCCPGAVWGSLGALGSRVAGGSESAPTTDRGTGRPRGGQGEQRWPFLTALHPMLPMEMWPMSGLVGRDISALGRL